MELKKGFKVLTLNYGADDKFVPKFSAGITDPICQLMYGYETFDSFFSFSFFLYSSKHGFYYRLFYLKNLNFFHR